MLRQYNPQIRMANGYQQTESYNPPKRLLPGMSQEEASLNPVPHYENGTTDSVRAVVTTEYSDKKSIDKTLYRLGLV